MLALQFVHLVENVDDLAFVCGELAVDAFHVRHQAGKLGVKFVDLLGL